MKVALLLALAAFAQAQYLIESSSFGQGDRISPNQYAIPRWHISGEGHTPQLLSDKVGLTPPYPGNRRGALWAEASVTKTEWIADFEFRATGPERGGGNLQLWYVRGGQAKVGTSSIYTAGKFDGMVLVIDMYGGRGGSIRGFLNDGNTDFSNHHAVDSLAFGHCDYAYRNLGRPSRIQIKQESNSFEVNVDGRQCFRSEQIKLPTDYHFGISAASAETPDSFEVFKFVLSTTPALAREEVRRYQAPPQQQEQVSQQESTTQQSSNQQDQDTPASSITSQDAQFADLHNRLQKMEHSINNLFRDFSRFAGQAEQRHAEMMQKSISGDHLNAVLDKLQTLERTMNSVQAKVDSRDYQKNFDKLHSTLADSHSNILEGLPQTVGQIVSTSAPRMGTFLFIVLAFQLLLAGSYIMYKRRRANAPKKYL